MTSVIPPLLEDSSPAKALERIAAALERLAGEQSLSGWSHLIGSNAKTIVRHAKCSVLVIRT